MKSKYSILIDSFDFEFYITFNTYVMGIPVHFCAFLRKEWLELPLPACMHTSHRHQMEYLT
jgi:hypothetical protein